MLESPPLQERVTGNLIGIKRFVGKRSTKKNRIGLLADPAIVDNDSLSPRPFPDLGDDRVYYFSSSSFSFFFSSLAGSFLAGLSSSSSSLPPPPFRASAGTIPLEIASRISP